MLIVDSRQKAGKHVTKNTWWIKHGVPLVTMKLDFGDYQRPGSNISIDTKNSIQELVMDVGRDHARFVRECERAAAAGYRLLVLVESNEKYNDSAQLERWVSDVCKRCRMCSTPREKSRRCRRGSRPMHGQTLVKILATLEKKYGVRFEFTSKRNCAKRICEVLGIEYQ